MELRRRTIEPQGADQRTSSEVAPDNSRRRRFGRGIRAMVAAAVQPEPRAGQSPDKMPQATSPAQSLRNHIRSSGLAAVADTLDLSSLNGALGLKGLTRQQTEHILIWESARATKHDPSTDQSATKQPEGRPATEVSAERRAAIGRFNDLFDAPMPHTPEPTQANGADWTESDMSKSLLHIYGDAPHEKVVGKRHLVQAELDGVPIEITRAVVNDAYIPAIEQAGQDGRGIGLPVKEFQVVDRPGRHRFPDFCFTVHTDTRDQFTLDVEMSDPYVPLNHSQEALLSALGYDPERFAGHIEGVAVSTAQIDRVADFMQRHFQG